MAKTVLKRPTVALAGKNGESFEQALDAALVDAFREAHAALGDGVCVWDRTGLVHSNPAFERMIGVPASQLAKARSIVEFVVAEDRERIATRLRIRFRDTQGMDRGETTLVRPDGRVVPVDYVAKRIRPDDPHLLLWIFHDLDRERKMDADLLASEERFRAFSTNLSDGLFFLGDDGNILESNEGAEHLSGRSRADVTGKPLASLLSGSHRAAFGELVQTTLAGPTYGLGRSLEAEIELPDGGRVPVEFAMMRLVYAEGPRCAVLARSLIERRRTEAKGRSAVESLERVNAARTNFINMAAHELRTPLAPMKAEISLLKSAGHEQLGNDQRRSVDTLSRGIERLSTFVEDLLEVSRMQAGKIDVHESSFDLYELLAKTVSLFETAAKYGEVSMEVNGRPGVRVTADPMRIEQVVFNLLSNALKFTPPGGKVIIGVADEGRHGVVVEVKDSGEGLRPEDIKRLFEPFAAIRKDRQRRQKGAGLGLYICKTLVELHGGQIWAQSAGLNRGATFSFRLPRGRTPTSPTS